MLRRGGLMLCSKDYLRLLSLRERKKQSPGLRDGAHSYCDWLRQDPSEIPACLQQGMSVGGQGNTRDGFPTQLLMIPQEIHLLRDPRLPTARHECRRAREHAPSLSCRTSAGDFPEGGEAIPSVDPFRTDASTQRKKALENGLLRNMSY